MMDKLTTATSEIVDNQEVLDLGLPDDRMPV
jgi:hypothetical protein